MKFFSLYVVCLLFFSVTSLAQSVNVKERKYQVDKKYVSAGGLTIVYPLIIAPGNKASTMINKTISDAIVFRDDGSEHKSVATLLQERIKDGLTDLDYTITYNRNGILSLHLDLGTAAAYPTTETLYFNFDINTGELLTIKDLLTDSAFDRFRAQITADRLDSLKQYKTSYLPSLLQGHEVDSGSFDMAIYNLEACMSNFDASDFILSKESMSIMPECEFAHVIKSLSPDFKLKYSYVKLGPYLKPKFRKKFSK